MRFNRLVAQLLLCFAFTVGELPINHLRAQEDFNFALSVKPAKCIALRKGQDCFQTLKFHWRTPQQGEYCLTIQGLDKPLHCWQGNSEKVYVYEFVSQETRRFSLRNHNGDVLREVEVVVAWVYNSGRRESTGWRLF